MKIIVKVNQENDIYTLTNADGYILSCKNFSYRYDESFSISKIKKVRQFTKKNNKSVYVLVNKIFKDAELDDLKEFLKKLKDIHVDGIYFTDFAVFMLAKEVGIEQLCVFYHETFLRNSYDILTYQSYGISNIICSKDMNMEDIVHLPVEKKDNYGILAFGYYPIYESKRKIITNYVNLNQLPKEIIHSKNLTLREDTREEFYKVLEQDGTASVFADKPLNYLPFLKQLKEHIDTFIIDALFFETSYIYEVINCFKENDENKLEKLDESISFTTGFLNKRIGLM